jgi:hypothetical protein
MDMDHDNDDNNYNNYEDDISDVDDDDDDDDKLPGEADAPPEDKNLHWVHLLAGVVRTNQDYSLGPMVPLPDASAAALAASEAVELQAPTLFTSHSLVLAGGFSEEDLPICFHCWWWNLMAPFLQCNLDSWTGCGRCTYIQHTRCKNVSLPGLSLPLLSCYFV